MGVIVAFSFEAWVARYPEFQNVAPGLAAEFFNEATILHRNDGGGPVSTAAIQSTLLNMLTAHIAARYATVNGIAPSALVGRITNASEGSVSVAAVMGEGDVGIRTWLNQTKYGADYFAATAQYRKFRYMRGHPRTFTTFPPFGGFRSGF